MPIHPTAIVSPTAEIAENVTIEAYSIIGPQVTIDSGTVVGPHVVIDGKTTIGENNHYLSLCFDRSSSAGPHIRR